MLHSNFIGFLYENLSNAFKMEITSQIAFLPAVCAIARIEVISKENWLIRMGIKLSTWGLVYLVPMMIKLCHVYLGVLSCATLQVLIDSSDMSRRDSQQQLPAAN